MRDKRSFLLYADLIHTVNQLPNEKAGELFKHILSYVNDENPSTEDLIIKLSFEPIKQQLKRDLKKWESISEKRRAAANDRWNNQKEDEASKDMQMHSKASKSTDLHYDNDTVTVNDTVINKELEKIPFSKFWDLYDKKIDAKKCEPKWNRLSLSQQQKALTYIPAYIKENPEKKFRRNPETFLNNLTWENEIIKDEQKLNGFGKVDHLHIPKPKFI